MDSHDTPILDSGSDDPTLALFETAKAIVVGLAMARNLSPAVFAPTISRGMNTEIRQCLVRQYGANPGSAHRALTQAVQWHTAQPIEPAPSSATPTT